MQYVALVIIIPLITLWTFQKVSVNMQNVPNGLIWYLRYMVIIAHMASQRMIFEALR